MTAIRRPLATRVSKGSVTKPTQREHRRGVTVGKGLTDVIAVTDLYRSGHFEGEDEARGAFKLAYQQGLDGMGDSIAAWMGMTSAEFDAWMRSSSLPAKRPKQ
jgi:hypothetical protein